MLIPLSCQEQTRYPVKNKLGISRYPVKKYLIKFVLHSFSEHTTTSCANSAIGTFFFVNDGGRITILRDGANRAHSNNRTTVVLRAVFFAYLDHLKFLIISCFIII
jgi:hypothetical protein